LSLTKSSGETDDIYDDACNAGVPNGMYAGVDLLQQEKQTDKIMCNIRSNCPNHHSPVVSGFQLPTFQTRFTHKFIMLLLASSDSKNSSFT